MNLVNNYRQRNRLLEGYCLELFGNPNTEVPVRAEKCICALEGRQEIGAIWYFPERINERNTVFLKRLFVQPQQRGSGLGRLLVERVVQEFPDAESIRLIAPKKVWGFYSGLGFKVERIFFQDRTKYAIMKKEN